MLQALLRACRDSLRQFSLASMVLVGLLLAGCTSQTKDAARFTTVGEKIGAAEESATHDARHGGDGGAMNMAKAVVAEKRAAEAKGEAAAKPVAPAKEAPPPVAAVKEIGGNGGGAGMPLAGQLTAGSFDDNLRFNIYQAFLRRTGDKSLAGAMTGRFQGRHLVLTVKNANGSPVQNARVQVRAKAGPGVDLLSRSDGRAIVVTPWDTFVDDTEWTVTVTSPDGGEPIVEKIDQQTREHTIVLEKSAALPESLDLALVLDTTGSMGDEIAYLKSEMSWIAGEIKKRFPNVKQRYALICYRDLTDEYIARTFEFTDRLEHFTGNLAKQGASGGGDFPEAVHKAFEQAVQLKWHAGRTARIIVHVADAPPHTQDFDQTMKHVNQLRKTGVTYYPVACSGYDPACEFLMRTSALVTGGQFLFLTDDSGIGNAHAEPTTNGYHVERLNSLLVRMIASELSGERIAPQQNEIIRTVGVPQAAAKR